MSVSHDDYIRQIVSQKDSQGRVKSRERNNFEYKETFGFSSWAKYAKTMAAFANNQGGYILFGIKDSPREVKGVNPAFNEFTESLNSLFSPEIIWECGTVDVEGISIGYIYTEEAIFKPVISLRSESSEKLTSGDVFYRYRGRSEKLNIPK